MFENMDWAMLIGQALGVVAVILGFVTYQMKSSKTILILNMITTVVFCVHYLLIGAITGFALNFIGFFRSLVYASRNKKIFSGSLWPCFFALVMLIAGIFTWQDWRSILPLCGLVINTLGLSLKKAQHIRYSLLISCPLVLLYNLLVRSYGGAVFEAMSIASSLIGIYRFRKTENETA